MGVRGLFTFINTVKTPNDELTFPLPNDKRATVLIDTLSINLAKDGYQAFLNTQVKNKRSCLHPDSDIVGGESSLLAEATRRFLTTMRDHLHMNIRLLRDARRFKEKQESLVEGQVVTPATGSSPGSAESCVAYEARNLTLSKRQKKREDEVCQVLRYAQGLSYTKQIEKNYHSPNSQICPHNFAMIIDCVVKELNEEANSRGDPPSTQILVHRAVEGECDEEIGQLVVDSSADLIISSDSDLALSNHGAPVTLFSWVNFGALMDPPESWRSVMRFPVFSHARLCSALNLTPSPSALQRALQPGSSSVRDKKSLLDQFLAIPNDDTLFLYVACGINGNDIITNVYPSDTASSSNSYLTELYSLTKTFVDPAAETWSGTSARKNIKDVCIHLSIFRERARQERLQTTRNKNVDSPTSTPFLTCLSKWLLDDSSLLKASTEQYLQSSSFRFRNADSKALSETIEVPLPPPNFAPGLFRCREQLGYLLNLYMNDRVGSSFLILVEGLPTAEEVDEEYFFYRLVESEHPFHKLKTTTRLLGLKYALIEAQRKVLGVQSDGMPMESQEDPSATTGVRTVPMTSWYEAIQSPESVRRQMFFNVFNPDFRTVAEGIDAAVRSNCPEKNILSSNNAVDALRSSSFHPTCAQVILWLLQPALSDDELRVMGAFLMFTSATSSQQRKMLEEMKQFLLKEYQEKSSPVSPSVSSSFGMVNAPGKARYVPLSRRSHYGQSMETSEKQYSDKMYTRPSPREVELSFLFRHAVAALKSVGNTLNFESTDYMFFPSPSTFSHILQSFSGSALHYMYKVRNHLESVECLQDIMKSDAYLSMIQAVLENARRFQIWDRTQTDGSDVSITGEKGEEKPFKSGPLVSSPLQSTCGSMNIPCGLDGIPRLEELVDSLDSTGMQYQNVGGIVEGRGKEIKANKSVHGRIWSFLPELESSEVVLADSSLPILEFIPKIIQDVNRNNVVCIQGETGCGKSSRIPLEIYRDATSRGKQVRIVVTQPRRIAAVSLAGYVASLLEETVGETVGYRLGGGHEYHKESPQTCIFFVTTGYLLESLIGSPSAWDNVTHFILDEVHERSLEADVLSLVLKVRLGEQMGLSLWDFEELDKKVLDFDTSGEAIDESIASQEKLSKNERTTRGEHSLAYSKVLVMSATIQAKLFKRYFAPLMQERCLPPNIFVGAKRFPVKEYFLDEFISSFPTIPATMKGSLARYCKAASAEKCPSLVTENCRSIVDVIFFCVTPGASILVFLPGWEAIENMADALNTLSAVDAAATALRVFPVHSIMDIQDQQKSITMPEKNECNIILATNVAETSITIPGLRTVIDAGMCKRMKYDAKRKIRMLICQWCSKSGAKQRAGRSGRVSPGLVIRMYTKKVFEEYMSDFDQVEYYPLEYSVLQISYHLSHFGDIRRVMRLLLEPTSIDDVSDAITSLIQMSTLDKAEQVTSFGRTALRLPVDLRMTMGLLLAASLGCAAEMVVVVAGLSMQKELFVRPLPLFFDCVEKYQQKVIDIANTASEFQRIPLSDIHVFLTVYQKFSELLKAKDVKSGLAWRAIKTFRNSVRDIARRFNDLNVPLDPIDQEYMDCLMSAKDTENRNTDGRISSQGRRESNNGEMPFRVGKSPFLNSLLQIALVTTSQWSSVLLRAVVKEKHGKNSVDSFGSPALRELPWGTKTSLNPMFLSFIVKIRPIGFLLCDPHILPYYLSRTAIFSLPQKLKERICEDLQKNGCEEKMSDDCGWTASQSPAVKAFEGVLSKVFGEKVALTVSLVHSQVVLTIDPTALGITTTESGNGNDPGKVYTSQGTQGKVTLMKNSKKNAPATSEENETKKEIPVDSVVTIKEVPSSRRFQLLPLHPSLVGIIMSQLISRGTVDIPLTLESWGSEGSDMVALKNFTVAFLNYTIHPLVDHSPTNALSDVWRSLSCPYVLPVLSKATNAIGVPPSALSSQTTFSTPQKELRGIGEGPLFAASFSAMEIGNKLKFGHSTVLFGTPLQLLLSVASNSFVFDKVQNFHTVSLEFTLQCDDDLLLSGGWRMFYISKFDKLSLMNTFNTSDISTSRSSRGAPLHGLVSLLTLSVISHASKFPSFFHEKVVKLVSLMKRIDDISLSLPDLSETQWTYSTFDVLLEYKQYQFLNESHAWLPDVEQVLQELSKAVLEEKKNGMLSSESFIPDIIRKLLKEVCQVQSEICSLCGSSDKVIRTKNSAPPQSVSIPVQERNKTSEATRKAKATNEKVPSWKKKRDKKKKSKGKNKVKKMV